MPTAAADHVFSAHAHKLPGSDRQTYTYILYIADEHVYDHVCSADAKCVQGMYSIEL